MLDTEIERRAADLMRALDQRDGDARRAALAGCSQSDREAVTRVAEGMNLARLNRAAKEGPGGAVDTTAFRERDATLSALRQP